jgi:hypothetical protein
VTSAALGNPVTVTPVLQVASNVTHGGEIDPRPSRNGSGAERVCRRVMERRRRLFAYLGYPVTVTVTPRLGRVLASRWIRMVDVTDFDCRETENFGTVPVASRSLRECRGSDGATAQAVCIPRDQARVSGRTEACTRVASGVVGRCDRLSTVEKRWWDCARGLAQSARVPGERWSDGAGCMLILGIRLTTPRQACTHVGAGS